MPNETRKSNKIQSKISKNFFLKHPPRPPPPPPCHDGMITSVLPVPYLSVHDMIRFWPIRKECMYDETNYIMQVLNNHQKKKEKGRNLNGQITRDGKWVQIFL